MKTLIFSFSLIILAFTSAVASADPYDKLAWGPLDPPLTTAGAHHAPNLSALSFRQFFRQKPPADFHALIKECGLPDDEWNSESQTDPAHALPVHMPLYPGGHIFRYNFSDGSHVYIWTGVSDAYVMRADYFFSTGHVEPLYFEPL